MLTATKVRIGSPATGDHDFPHLVSDAVRGSPLPTKIACGPETLSHDGYLVHQRDI